MTIETTPAFGIAQRAILARTPDNPWQETVTEFAGRTAVATGGGSGMGRELVGQPVAEAATSQWRCLADRWRKRRGCARRWIAAGLGVTTHIADVAERTQVERFRDEVADRHQIDKIHLLAGTNELAFWHA